MVTKYSNPTMIIEYQIFSLLVSVMLEMARAAKKSANEPLTGLFTGLLTARFYLCLLLDR